jgi:hypothetical protein
VGCISQQTRKSIGQVLVPVPAHHTFEIDSWPPITGSRAPRRRSDGAKERDAAANLRVGLTCQLRLRASMTSAPWTTRSAGSSLATGHTCCRSFRLKKIDVAQKPEPPQPITWNIFRAAKKAVWVGEVEATDERDAIAKAADQFKQDPAKLIAMRETPSGQIRILISLPRPVPSARASRVTITPNRHRESNAIRCARGAIGRAPPTPYRAAAPVSRLRIWIASPEHLYCGKREPCLFKEHFRRSVVGVVRRNRVG